jgi:hypothetical protein
MKFPEIIIIGNPRCGTTALWYNLDKHPRINMATPKKYKIEMYFWKMQRWGLGIDWYKKRFTGELSGEKTTGYSARKKSMKEISKYIPDAKLIICIRNPVDRAYSHYLMNRRSKRVLPRLSYKVLRRYDFQGSYINQIEKNVLPFFDSSQLKICILEYMKNDLTYEMKKIFEFIGVEDLNYNPQIPIRGRNRIEDIKLNHKEKFYRIWSTGPEKLTGSLRSRMVEKFKPLNKRLFDYLGYEIDGWRK